MRDTSDIFAGEPFGEPFGEHMGKTHMGDTSDIFGDIFGDDLSGDPIDDALRAVGDALGIGDMDVAMIGEINKALTSKSLKTTGIGKVLQTKYNAMQKAGLSGPANQLKQSIDTLKKIPGGIGEAAAFPPYVIKNGNMVKYNTRATIQGMNLSAFIYRFESQLIGSSRYLTQNGAGVGATNTFTFGAGVGNELAFAGPILIMLRSSDLNAVDDFDVQLAFAAAVQETGNAYSAFGNIRFAVKREKQKDGSNATYVFLFPFIDLATILLPVALRAQGGANSLVMTLLDVPTTYTAQVTLLAPDSKYWVDFKQAFGLSGTSKITTYK